MRYAVVPVVAFLLVLSPAALPASAGSVLAKGGAGSLGPGVASSVFGAAGELGVPGMKSLGERLPLGATRVEAPGAFLSEPRPARAGSGSRGAWSRRNTAVAILASAILPGMGELYCYRSSRDPWTLARVPAFLAVEGYLWYSYADNHKIGKDFKRDYEAFADAHWSLDRFLHKHPCCNVAGDSCDSWQDYNDRCKNSIPYFFYTPRETDREEYYENIGKYDAFVFGWDDAATYTVDNYQYWTKNRTTYVGLRNESDRYLLRADQRLMWLMVDRIVSMLDTGWLAYRISKGQNPDKGWSLRFKTVDETPIVLVNRRF